MKTFLLIILVFAGLTWNESNSDPVTIELNNPSFEITKLGPYGAQPCCKAPRGWYACGDVKDGTPDIQPGHFNTSLDPYDENYYLSMVVRDNETYESVSQKLSTPLVKGQPYSFSLALASCNEMVSKSRAKGNIVEYNTPAVLRIWGGNNYCSELEILAKTQAIDHHDWVVYNLTLKSEREDIEFITFEAFYKTPVITPYNGNILMDACSEIVPIIEEQVDKE